MLFAIGIHTFQPAYQQGCEDFFKLRGTSINDVTIKRVKAFVLRYDNWKKG